MGPPKLPPFAGAVVSFDRRGERVVACVDRSTAPPKPGMALPAGPKLPPAYRIWLIEREVMQELMATGGLCGPAWSPDGKSFVAAGARGLFVFTEPNYEARVLVLTPSPAPGTTQTPAGPAAVAAPALEPAPIPYSQVSWSPGGRRIAFLATLSGVTTVRVVDAKDGAAVLGREMAAKLLQWGADDRSLTVDGARIGLP
jgi:hypothetical protein